MSPNQPSRSEPVGDRPSHLTTRPNCRQRSLTGSECFTLVDVLYLRIWGSGVRISSGAPFLSFAMRTKEIPRPGARQRISPAAAGTSTEPRMPSRPRGSALRARAAASAMQLFQQWRAKANRRSGPGLALLQADCRPQKSGAHDERRFLRVEKKIRLSRASCAGARRYRPCRPCLRRRSKA